MAKSPPAALLALPANYCGLNKAQAGQIYVNLRAYMYIDIHICINMPDCSTMDLDFDVPHTHTAATPRQARTFPAFFSFRLDVNYARFQLAEQAAITKEVQVHVEGRARVCGPDKLQTDGQRDQHLFAQIKQRQHKLENVLGHAFCNLIEKKCETHAPKVTKAKAEAEAVQRTDRAAIQSHSQLTKTGDSTASWPLRVGQLCVPLCVCVCVSAIN